MTTPGRLAQIPPVIRRFADRSQIAPLIFSRAIQAGFSPGSKRFRGLSTPDFTKNSKKTLAQRKADLYLPAPHDFTASSQRGFLLRASEVLTVLIGQFVTANQPAAKKKTR